MYVDWIVSRHFAIPATDLSLVELVSGDVENLNKYPATFYTEGNDEANTSKKLDLLVKELSIARNRPNRAALSTLVEQSFFSNNLLSQKTALLLAFFLRALSQKNLEATAFMISCTPAELESIENMRKDMIKALRKRIRQDNLIEEQDIILSYFTNVRTSGTILGSKDFQALENSFICKNLTLNTIRSLIRVNLGNKGIPYIYDFKYSEFYTKKHICEELDKVSKSSWTLVVNQTLTVQRHLIKLIELGLMFYRGFYSQLSTVASKISPQTDSSTFMIAIATLYKVINPISFVVKISSSILYAAGASAAPSLLAAIPVLLFVAWVKSTGGMWGFEAMVSAGAISHKDFSKKTVENFYSKKISQPEILNESEELRKGIADFQKSLTLFDNEVKLIVKKASQSPETWDARKLPYTFQRVCANVAMVKGNDKTADFLFRLKNDRTFWNQAVDDWLQYYSPINLAENVSRSLQMSVTIDDIIDAKGNVRTPGEICAAIFLRLQMTEQTWFDKFAQSFVPAKNFT